MLGLLSSGAGVIYCQLVLCLFGAAAAVNLPALGGAVITPSVMFLPFLVARAWSEQHGHKYSRRLPQAGLWLALVVIWGLVSAYFMPRIFAGDIDIVGVDRGGGTKGPTLGPLRPVSGNLTQGGYALGGFMAFLSMHALLEKPGRLQHFRDGVLLLAALDVFAAGYNLCEYHLGFPKILDYVRTAYTLFDAYEIAGTGLMRIHGTFTETAGFSGFSLPVFAFCFSLWLHKVRPLYTGALSLALIVLLAISTSTTAYVGLALYGVMLAFVLTYRGYLRGIVPRIGLLVAGGLLLFVVVGSTFVFETQFSRQLEGYVELTVFNKMASASGIERSFWNRQAWSNFVDTYGLGVGLGSVRASSLALVLLSNLGVIGTVFFLAFLRRVLTGTRQAVELEPVPEAARQAVLASLAASLPSGTVFDLGILFYSYAAAACAIPVREVGRVYGPQVWLNADAVRAGQPVRGSLVER